MKKELQKLDYEEKLFLNAFKKFDKDGNGYVSFEELKKALCGTGDRMSDEDVRYFFQEADLNNDGKIDYNGK
jgi:calmodulin